MRRFQSMVVVAALVFGLAQAAVATVIVQNGDFETPTNTVGYTTGTFSRGTVDPATIPGWTFGPSGDGSYDGLTTSSYFGGNTFHLPSGSLQAAFIEEAGTFSQSMSGFSAGSFTVSFLAEGRADPYGPMPIQVKLDNTVLTFGGPTVTTVAPVNGSMASYTSDSITIASGSHTLTFLGASTNDLITAIDNVSIGGTSSVPEPSTLVLLVAGLLALLAHAWKKRK